MLVFWRLILGHFLSDFTFQTNYIADWKRRSRLGLTLHICTHPLFYMVLTWPYLQQPWVVTRWFHLNGWVCIGLITFFHWLEDIWRIWRIQETESPDSTGLFLWDQAVHVVMIFAFAPTLPGTQGETWVKIALGVVLLTHFTSVLIYFIENDLWGNSTILDHKKYYYIGERVLGASLFLLPGGWFLLALGWLGWIVYTHYKHPSERTWVHLVVGNLSVIVLGLIIRGLLS